MRCSSGSFSKLLFRWEGWVLGPSELHTIPRPGLRERSPGIAGQCWPPLFLKRFCVSAGGVGAHRGAGRGSARRCWAGREVVAAAAVAAGTAAAAVAAGTAAAAVAAGTAAAAVAAGTAAAAVAAGTAAAAVAAGTAAAAVAAGTAAAAVAAGTAAAAVAAGTAAAAVVGTAGAAVLSVRPPEKWETQGRR
ncbi:Golgi associated RAB2B interactor protein 3-like [Elephas maximus indicus]|uniref:Golgi associated RAB2B interactor protein 3-like n=1 Tax=Elephas maximus indicus TaxID=99487 RepID=UPI0021163612|nr:Golgi associated RAB2B interactor protein 3-like [Elephas maximus indicus]